MGNLANITAALLAVWISFILYNMGPRLFYIVRPDLLPDTNAVAASPNGVLPACDGIVFRDSVVMHDIHDFQRAAAIMRELNVPVVFKKFREDPQSLWTNVYSEYQSTKLTQTRVKYLSFGNMFMAGTRTYIHDVFNITLSDIVDRDSETSYYASFASFLSYESLQNLFGNISKKFYRDTNFISNFPDDVIASTLHSASYISSFSLQLLGKKVWVWVPPADMEEIGIISGHTANFHYKGSEADYMRKKKVWD